MLKNLPPVFARIRSALMRRGRTEHEADDLVQEAWIRLACYEHRDEVKEPEAFMMRIALNLSVDEHRARQAHGAEVELDDVVLVDAAPGVEDIVLGRERVDRLSVCLKRLPEKSRDMFISCRVEGQTYREIAQRYGLSITRVEQCVAHATLQITAWMKGW